MQRQKAVPMGLARAVNLVYAHGQTAMPMGIVKRLNMGHTRLGMPVGIAEVLYVNAGKMGRGFVLTGTCMTRLRHTREIIIP